MLSYDYKVVARYSPTYKTEDMEEKIKDKMTVLLGKRIVIFIFI